MQGVIRELKKKTGLDVQVDRLLYLSGELTH